jgi:hypothetical protein
MNTYSEILRNAESIRSTRYLCLQEVLLKLRLFLSKSDLVGSLSASLRERFICQSLRSNSSPWNLLCSQCLLNTFPSLGILPSNYSVGLTVRFSVVSEMSLSTGCFWEAASWFRKSERMWFLRFPSSLRQASDIVHCLLVLEWILTRLDLKVTKMLLSLWTRTKIQAQIPKMDLRLTLPTIIHAPNKV